MWHRDLLRPAVRDTPPHKWAETLSTPEPTAEGLGAGHCTVLGASPLGVSLSCWVLGGCQTILLAGLPGLRGRWWQSGGLSPRWGEKRGCCWWGGCLSGPRSLKQSPHLPLGPHSLLNRLGDDLGALSQTGRQSLKLGGHQDLRLQCELGAGQGVLGSGPSPEEES